MTRQAYVHHPSKTVVFWSPKVGFSSIANEFARLVAGQDLADLKVRRVPVRSTLDKEHFVRHPGARSLVVKDGYRSVVMSRDPFDRAISGYLNKFVFNNGRKLLSLDALEPFAKNFAVEILEYGGSVPTESFPGITFREFCQHCFRKIEERGGQEPDLDHHWNTQIPFSYYNSCFRYDFAFMIDEADLFFAKLAELTGLPFQERRENKGGYARKNETPQKVHEDKSLVDVPSFEIAKSGAFSKRNFQDPQLRDLLMSHYVPDADYIKRFVSK